MQHVYMAKATREYATEWADNQQGKVVHYAGAAIISNQTLCGYVDLVGVDWTLTNRRVNCQACIAIKQHVTGR